jgi:O-antigen ligase
MKSSEAGKIQVKSDSPVNRIRIYLGILLGLTITSVFIYPFPIHPITSLLIYLIITFGTLTLFTVDFRLQPHEQIWRNSIPGLTLPCILFFAGWSSVRWMFMDVSFTGRPVVLGHLWLALGIVTGMYIAGLNKRIGQLGGHDKSGRHIPDSGIAWKTTRRFLVMATLGFTLHALYQYFISHPETFRHLQQTWSGSVMDLYTQSILHAFDQRRIGGRLGDSNLFSSQLAMLTVFCLATTSRREYFIWRITAWISYGLCCWVVFLTGSRGGLLTLVVASLFMAVYLKLNTGGSGTEGSPASDEETNGDAAGTMKSSGSKPGHRRKKKHTYRMFFIMLLLAGFLAIQSRVFSETFIQRLANIETIWERLFYWQIAFNLWLENPLFGSGPGSFELLYGMLKPDLARESRHAHSWIFQALGELGIPGLILILAFWLSVLRRAIGLVLGSFRTGSQGGLETVWLLSGGCLMCFSGLFQITMENRDFLFVTGLLCGSGLSIAAGGNGNRSMTCPGLMKCIYLFLIGVAVILTPRSQFAAFHKWRSVDLMQEEKWDEAEKALEKAGSWLPDHPQYLVSRADLKMRYKTVKDGENSYSMAWPLLVMAADLNPYSASIMSIQSRWYHGTGRTDEAIMAVGEAIRRYPSKVAYRLERCGLYLEAGRKDDARRDIEFIEKYDLPLWEYEMPRMKELRESLE